MLVELRHRSSIPGARWCQPVGWEPANEVPGAEYVDGSWWGEDSEAAGLVAFADGEEGEVVDLPVGGLRVAACGDCRVSQTVAVDYRPTAANPYALQHRAMVACTALSDRHGRDRAADVWLRWLRWAEGRYHVVPDLSAPAGAAYVPR